jgi:CheY-like chemotaxis protein
MRKNILVVEDDAITRNIYEQILTDLGHDFVCAENGEVGIELLSAQKFDAMLLDLLMPVMDGFEVLRWMTQNGYQDVPVVVYTQADTQNTADFKKMAKSFGAFVTHDKPIVLQTVKESIEAALK